MRLKHEAPSGTRIKSRFLGIEVDNYLWWSYDRKCWGEFAGEGGTTNIAPCKTERAFKRHLRKNKNIAGRATLLSRFIGYDVFA